MPPRGRPRKRNTRMDVAIDAMGRFGFEEALVVKTVKTLLNDVYGGDDCWQFIEEDNYKELFEVLLVSNAEKGNDNGEEEGKREGRHLQNNSSQDQGAASTSVCTTSESVADSEPAGPDVVQAIQEPVRTEEVENVAPPPSHSPVRNMDCDPPVERNGSGWKDITLDQTSDGNGTATEASNRDKFAQTNSVSGQINGIPSSSTVGSLVQPANHHTIRRPCYGWIDSEESELDFMYLTPAARETPPPSMLSGYPNGETRRARKRDSRWDIMP